MPAASEILEAAGVFLLLFEHSDWQVRFPKNRAFSAEI